ncbi:MAG: DUF4062 domain-containing protein, partial [Candidatus Marinimicrobia bacterium]|nr:DUF4062 domain-containing protein [Candidatus Neomarinimicrobiota bacterium]
MAVYRSKRFRIFISSPIEELTEERAGVEELLRSPEIFNPIRVENLPASGDASRRVCLREVAEADAIILILKARYGFVPEENNPKGLSVTHLEYHEARRLNKPVFAFLFEEAQPEPELASFIQELSNFDKGVYRKKWSTTVELAEAALRALFYWIARRAKEIGSEEVQQQVTSEIDRYPNIGLLPVVADPATFEDRTVQSWHETLLDQLRLHCTRRLLPTPYLVDQQQQGNAQPTLSLRVRPASQVGRFELAIEVLDPQQESSFPGPVKFDAALTDEGARFEAQCCLAFVL